MEHILNLIKLNNSKGGFNFTTESFMFKDWNVYYDLYNVENFEDPDDAPSWYQSEDVYVYSETPHSNEWVLI